MMPKKRPPTAPGEILKLEFLEPLGLTQQQLARQMNVPIQRLNGVITGKRAITPETAILLGRTLETTPQFWMTLQMNLDLWHAERKMAKQT